MITIKVKPNPNARDFKLFNEFADKHWGKDTHFTQEEVNCYFFAKAQKIIFAEIDGVLVGTANIGIRNIILGGENILLGTVGGIVTHGDFRHMGIASKILEGIRVEMIKDKIDVGILCTEIKKLGSLYGKTGFIPLGKPYYFIDKNGVERENKDGMVAEICSTEKFQKILNSPSKIEVGLSDF